MVYNIGENKNKEKNIKGVMIVTGAADEHGYRVENQIRQKDSVRRL